MLFRSVLILLLCGTVFLTQRKQVNDSLEIDNQKITLNEAVETALKNNPNLTVYEYEIESLEKRKLQAGLDS